MLVCDMRMSLFNIRGYIISCGRYGSTAIMHGLLYPGVSLSLTFIGFIIEHLQNKSCDRSNLWISQMCDILQEWNEENQQC